MKTTFITLVLTLFFGLAYGQNIDIPDGIYYANIIYTKGYDIEPHEKSGSVKIENNKITLIDIGPVICDGYHEYAGHIYVKHSNYSWKCTDFFFKRGVWYYEKDKIVEGTATVYFYHSTDVFENYTFEVSIPTDRFTYLFDPLRPLSN